MPEPPRYRVGHDDRWRLDAYPRHCGAWVDRGLVDDSRLGRQADLGHPVDLTNTGMLLLHRLTALHAMPICGSVGLQEPGSACRRPPGSALGGLSTAALPAWTWSCQWSSAAGRHAHGMMRRFGGAQSGPSRCEVAGPGHPSWSGGPFGGGLAARCLPNKAQRNACRGRRSGRVQGGRDGAAAASSPTIVADYLDSDATRRAAGPSGHARGPAALPFLVGPRGEVAVRGATGPQPACTSGTHGGRCVTLWDDGIPACSPPGGRAAALPSDPGSSGRLVCPILAGGLLTTSDDGGGGTVDDGWLPGERGPTRASGRRAAGGSGADGGGGDGGGVVSGQVRLSFLVSTTDVGLTA